jgi:hypothetical protein
MENKERISIEKYFKDGKVDLKKYQYFPTKGYTKREDEENTIINSR